jgi:hypothetical protein
LHGIGFPWRVSKRRKAGYASLRFLVASAHDRDFVVHGKYLFERAKDLLKRANRTPEASRNCEAVLFERWRPIGLGLVAEAGAQ